MNAVDTNISRLLRSMYREYAASVGLDPDAKYLHGSPIRPVVPLDVATDGVMIVGAYPSARFAVIEKIPDVPVADNMGPFENERWFDGSRIRVQPSARELEDYFLRPLGLKRADCWVTDLVKVFLFKKGHRDKYIRLGYEPPSGYEREKFWDIAQASLAWLRKEVEGAKPRLVITLGAEVAGVIRGVRQSRPQVELLQPSVDKVAIGLEVPTIHCAHPGILMRPAANNRWPREAERFTDAAKAHLEAKAQ